MGQCVNGSTSTDDGCHAGFSQEHEGEIPLAEAKKEGGGASLASNFVFLSTPF